MLDFKSYPLSRGLQRPIHPSHLPQSCVFPNDPKQTQPHNHLVRITKKMGRRLTSIVVGTIVLLVLLGKNVLKK
tara:strand:- start:35164 stop:35385 length:222 start_codon:yes stop_codon:yes gene_type:complete